MLVLLFILMQSGGPSYAVELGRLDGLSSTAASVNGKLPEPSFNLNQLNSLFAAHGLTQTDMIALSGINYSPITDQQISCQLGPYSWIPWTPFDRPFYSLVLGSH